MKPPRLLGAERNAPPHFAGRTDELSRLAGYSFGIPSFHEHALAAYRKMTAVNGAQPLPMLRISRSVRNVPHARQYRAGEQGPSGLTIDLS